MSKKSMFSFGGALAVAGLLALAAPRAAHAVASALVQVTNTSANPAATEDVTKQAAQLIEIGCGAIPSFSSSSPCSSESPAGNFTGNYATPATGSVVIISVDIVGYGASCAANSVNSVILEVGPYQRKTWVVGGLTTTHFSYPSGFVLAPSSLIQINDYYTSPCSVTIDMQGYVTPN